MQHVFFDVTNLRSYLERQRRLSGIQRVAVMLIEYTARELGDDKVVLCFHDEKTGSYQTVPYEAVEASGGVLSSEALEAALHQHKPATRQRPTLEKYARKPVKRTIHSTIRDLNAALGNHRHFEKRKTTLEAWRTSATATKTVAAPALRKDRFRDFFKLAQPGDHLILADAAWSVPLEHMKTAQAQGIACHFLIHDLIQIKAPELIAGSDQSLVFHDWLRETAGFVDSYLANSEATARDLRNFLETYGTAQRIDVVPLAVARLPIAVPERKGPDRAARVNDKVYPRLARTTHIDDKIRSLLKRPYVLCVGTMEARKNMWGLAQAWDRLRHQDDIELPRLVFAGNQGWLNQDFEKWMAATGNLHGWVEQVFSPSDDELDFLYRNCLFTAMPSFTEGWGLPVGESLSYGKTAVVSEAASLPEVGGDLVLYFDPHSIASMTSAVYRMLADESLRKSLEAEIAAAALRGWDEVARDLLAAVRRPA